MRRHARILLVGAALALGWACGGAFETPVRTPGSVGATLVTDTEKFAGGVRPHIEALAEHLQEELGLDPGEYYVNHIVDRYTNMFTFTLWHRAAFEPKYAGVSNPGGKCFTLTYDPDTRAFSKPRYWP